MASLPINILSEERYLQLDRQAETRSEFHDGEMFAMAGGSPNHSLLANRVGSLLDRQVPGGCRTFNSDLRIKVAAAGVYTYADCTVICGDLEYADDQRDVVLNPGLIAEVLSPSTEGYDRGKKFEAYRTLTSLREYLLISQERPHVEHYSKQDDGSWLLREASGLEGVVQIGRMKVRIELAELYSNVLTA